MFARVYLIQLHICGSGPSIICGSGPSIHSKIPVDGDTIQLWIRLNERVFQAFLIAVRTLPDRERSDLGKQPDPSRQRVLESIFVKIAEQINTLLTTTVSSNGFRVSSVLFIVSSKMVTSRTCAILRSARSPCRSRSLKKEGCGRE